MTDFLEPPVTGTLPSDTKLPADPALWTVRQLVAALAELEDALRDRPESSGAPVPAYLQAAIDRENAILAELHRRSVADPVPAGPQVIDLATAAAPAAAEPTPA